MSEKKKSDGTSDSFLAFAGSIFLIILIWNKYKYAALAWYLKYRIPLALGLTVLIISIYMFIKRKVKVRLNAKNEESLIIGKPDDENSVFVGLSKSLKSVYFRDSYRRMHIQVVGTTNAGKTESVILPLAIDDIKKGRGLLIVDGKSDRGLLDKLYAYAKLYGHAENVQILSLCQTSISHTFNPLDSGTPLELTERIFNALIFENEYFKGLQRQAFLNTLLIFQAAKIPPTFYRLAEALTSPRHLKKLVKSSTDPQIISWVEEHLSLSREEREQRTSGLVTQLRMFTVDETAKIFNPEKSQINLEEALAKNKIIYCQLPVLKIPTLGKATGKLVLQCLQSAVASRHMARGERQFFSVYLDDFTEYLTESFVSLLNKSRSANISIVFAHQALGDIAALGDDVKNTILTNSNLKVFMRTNEPDSAEYFSSVAGTTQTVKVTERQNSGVFGPTKPGMGSVRDAEEFKFHPNLFKNGLGVGDAVVILPHGKGSHAVQIKFRMLPDLEIPVIGDVEKFPPESLPPLEEVPAAQDCPPNNKLAHIPGTALETPPPKAAA